MMLYYTRESIYFLFYWVWHMLYLACSIALSDLFARESSYQKTFSCTVVMNVLFSAFFALYCVVFFPVQRAEYIEYSTTSKKERKKKKLMQNSDCYFHFLFDIMSWFYFLDVFSIKMFFLWIVLLDLLQLGAENNKHTHHIRWGYYLQTTQ